MRLKIEVTEEDWDVAVRAFYARHEQMRDPLRSALPAGIPPGLLWNTVSCSCPVAVAIWRRLGPLAKGYAPEVGTARAHFRFWGKHREVQMDATLRQVVNAFDYRTYNKAGIKPVTGKFEMEFT